MFTLVNMFWYSCVKYKYFFSHVPVQCNKCSIEMFIKLALTLFFKRQQHCKLSWLDKDSDKDQSQFDELFN
jgi:hypothetical protein